MFVCLTFSMTLEEVIAGCEEAWEFFGGGFRVLVPDNMSPVVAKADAVNPRLTREWLEDAQARGFVPHPAPGPPPPGKARGVAGGEIRAGNSLGPGTFLEPAQAPSK